MAQRGTDEHSIEGHFGNTGAEVVAMLADIMRNPRGQDFLQTGQDTGRQHLGAQGVRLQLAEVELYASALPQSVNCEHALETFLPMQTYSEIAIASQPISDLVHQFLCIFPYRGDGLILELGGHVLERGGHVLEFGRHDC